MKLQHLPILVIGAGTMGLGIAQVASLAGHPVHLLDSRSGAAAQARETLAGNFSGLIAKGRLEAATADAALARIRPLDHLDQLGAAAAEMGLVVEAIVEDLEIKRALLAELEARLPETCVLATNTSSLSVTALGRGLKHPGRLVGMHFFNPVPLMKLVEVVHGLQTDPAVAEAVFELSVAWGKTPVHAKSTPGFIVNRIARPYYAEALALLQEQAAAPQVIDACLKAAGFRMGPCELMDLIGHDTNFAVTRSVFDANFGDKRYAPSVVQAEMVAGGLLGRKTGRGFYAYPEGVPALPVAVHDAPTCAAVITVHGADAVADHLEQAAQQALAPQGWGPARVRDSGWTGLEIDGARLMMSDGRTAAELGARLGLRDMAVFDRPVLPPAGSTRPSGPGPALAYAVAETASPDWQREAPAWLAALGFAPLAVADSPGLVVARTLAMLINEAADAVLQGVCSADAADRAMKLGVNYPAGPFEWLADWGAAGVVHLLDALDTHYRGERYRVSPWLRRALWKGPGA